MSNSPERNLEATQGQSISQPIPLPWVEKLFERFSLIYGAKFLDLWANVDKSTLKKAWAEELAGYTGFEIKRGLDTCKTKAPTFPPTLFEFLAMCRPALTAEAAYYEAIEQIQRRADGKDAWTHRAIYWTAAKIGAHDLKEKPWVQIKTRWTAAFDETLAAGIWPEIPPHREALPAPGQTSITREEADKRISEISAKVGFVRRTEVGSKAWAHKLIARAKAGEDVGFVAERFAREAIAPTINHQGEIHDR